MPSQPMRHQHQVRDYQRRANMLLPARLSGQSAERLPARVRARWRLWWPWHVQQLQVRPSMRPVRHWGQLQDSGQSPCSVWLPQGVHWQRLHGMSAGVLWWRRLPSWTTRMLLWHLQKHLRGSLRHWSRLQSTRSDTRLQLPARHDWRSLRALSPLYQGGSLRTESLRHECHLCARPR